MIHGEKHMYIAQHANSLQRGAGLLRSRHTNLLFDQRFLKYISAIINFFITPYMHNLLVYCMKAR
jgi:hypothetical protein